jgi:hypothetical protein
MSSPSVEPCPEPVPYTTTRDAYMADIDFPTNDPVVFSSKPSFVDVDSIVANQVGPITNPVTGNTPEYNMEPVMPRISDSNASPVISSSMGADINAPSTLVSSNVSDFLSVNNIESFKQALQTPPVVKKLPALPVMNTENKPTVESFANTKPNTTQNTTQNTNTMKLLTNNNNLASFIANNKPKVNNNQNIRVKEHFGKPTNMSSTTILIILLILGAGVVYYMQHKDTMNLYLSQFDFSKIPILSELNDPNVSKNNKLMIVVGIVFVVFILLQVL